MKILLFVFAALLAVNARTVRFRRNTGNLYKMCVPEHLLDLCEEMSKQETKSAINIMCIPARDRLECLSKIKERLVDFLVVDPEDMYVAHKDDTDKELAIFEEIRTLEEPEAEFRYEGVALIHKDLKLDSLQSLKGLNSCHTGVGRNVGYKIPITKLRHMGILGGLNEPGLSARENELKALSQLFSKACIVGTWSPDASLNKQLKERYSNLCELCENPQKCDYPDNFSGYDGAIRCLIENHGQIAWTKVIYVKKAFGLPVGSNINPPLPSNYNAADYAYLCPDGSRVPILEPNAANHCRWAARPWQGYMVNTAIVKTPDELRRKIENLNTVGAKSHQEWLLKVLELSELQLPVANKAISPGDYLDKGNYTDVIERDYGPPIKTIRLCVTSDDEMAKCRDMSHGAFSRNVRPRIECTRGGEDNGIVGCMKLVQDNGADILKLDAGLVRLAEDKYNLKPIVREQYLEEKLDEYHTVAVVKKNSNYKSFAELRGARSCHTGFGTSAGYNAVLHTLLDLNLLPEDKCPLAASLAGFFSGGSCLPGVRQLNPELGEDVLAKLCSQCAGDCKLDSDESYSGYTGALRCLAEGKGDVAFLSRITLPANTDGKNKAAWALNLKSEDYELLCPNGGRASLQEYESCHLLKTPSHMIVTSNIKSYDQIAEIQNGLLSLSELYAERPDLFLMFGDYNGKPDILFKNAATGLKAIHGKPDLPKEYERIMTSLNLCN